MNITKLLYIFLSFVFIGNLYAREYIITLESRTNVVVAHYYHNDKQGEIKMIETNWTGHSQIRSKVRSFMIKTLLDLNKMPIEAKHNKDLALLIKNIKTTKKIDYDRLEGVIRPKVRIINIEDTKFYSSTEDEVYTSFKKIFDEIKR